MICLSCPNEDVWDVVDSPSGPTSVLSNGGIECGACEKFQCGECGDKAKAEQADPRYDDTLCGPCNIEWAKKAAIDAQDGEHAHLRELLR